MTLSQKKRNLLKTQLQYLEIHKGKEQLKNSTMTLSQKKRNLLNTQLQYLEIHLCWKVLTIQNLFQVSRLV